jgi:ABC-type branched-subunit amino acid transport system ATPase component
MMVAASLSLRGLTRHYGPVRAVDDLDLEVPEGAFVTLLGPSGCGKSTTLNLIAGLDEPTAGTIMLGDQDVTRRQPRKIGKFDCRDQCYNDDQDCRQRSRQKVDEVHRKAGPRIVADHFGVARRHVILAVEPTHRA